MKIFFKKLWLQLKALLIVWTAKGFKELANELEKLGKDKEAKK